MGQVQVQGAGAAQVAGRGSATTLRNEVWVTSRSWNAGQRVRSWSSGAKTGQPELAANVQGPAPAVNCSRSAVVAASSLAPSGVLCRRCRGC